MTTKKRCFTHSYTWSAENSVIGDTVRVLCFSTRVCAEAKKQSLGGPGVLQSVPGMRGHTWILKIGRQPITGKHLATCALTRLRARGQQGTITVPLWSIGAHSTAQGEAEKRFSRSRSDKSELAGAHRHGGHGVLRGAPRRRAPPRRSALRPPPSAQRLPASLPR
jgi:hypothetical protein